MVRLVNRGFSCRAISLTPGLFIFETYSSRVSEAVLQWSSLLFPPPQLDVQPYVTILLYLDISSNLTGAVRSFENNLCLI